jgi:nitroreductase
VTLSCRHEIKEVLLSYETALELMKNTRSIRRFKADPLPSEFVDQIIEAARWAPSGFNQQPWEFIIVREPALKNKIIEFCRASGQQSGQMEIAREEWQKEPRWEPARMENDFTVAPVFILLCGDTRTQEGLPMAVRCDKTRLQSIFTSSLANAFLYMHMAATALGLASQWVSASSTPYTQCMIKALLGIPKEMEIYDMLVLGYPAMKPRPKLLRDKAKMVHYDQCGPESFRTDEEVKDFIRKARAWNIATERRKADL